MTRKRRARGRGHLPSNIDLSMDPNFPWREVFTTMTAAIEGMRQSGQNRVIDDEELSAIWRDSADLDLLEKLDEVLAAKRTQLSMSETYLKSLGMFISEMRRIAKGIDHQLVSMIDQLSWFAMAAGYQLGRDRSFDLEERLHIEIDRLRAAQAREAQRAAANERRKAGNKVRDAALAYVQQNPKATQADCARAVASTTDRTVTHVTEVIKHMFEPTGRSDGSKRVRKEYLNLD